MQELGDRIYKSKSTISKYESGQIQIDIDSLYRIADALDIRVEKLLYIDDKTIIDDKNKKIPKFFKNLTRFYTYAFDGRNNSIIKSKCVITSKENNSRYKIIMYMNYIDEENYQACENTYMGYIEHFDAKTNILLTNRDTPMELGFIQIPASFLDSDIKWSLWAGFSTRPMMPVANKMLISKKPLKLDKKLECKLKTDKDDIKNLRHYNMFIVL